MPKNRLRIVYCVCFLLNTLFVSWILFSHFAVTSNPIVWRVVGHIHDYLNGCSYHVWVHQVRVKSLH